MFGFGKPDEWDSENVTNWLLTMEIVDKTNALEDLSKRVSAAGLDGPTILATDGIDKVVQVMRR